METASIENVEIEQSNDVQKAETKLLEETAIDQPIRQDYSSESNKIEISNLGKFAYAVGI